MSANADLIPKNLIDKLNEFRGKLTPLDGAVEYCPKAWFLGPKNENAEIFTELVVKAIKGHMDSRKVFHPEDSPIFLQDYKQDPVYQNATKEMIRKTEEVIEFLKLSLPYSSFRYQGHMTSDVTMASFVGSVATILYNPNNVTVQASPVTTFIEMAVSNDLCRMVGWEFPSEIPPPGISRHDKKIYEDTHIISSFHLTSGGSVANTEGFWASYWAKFIPLALKDALLNEAELSPAKDKINVILANGTAKKLIEVTSWEGANVGPDECVKLPYDVADLLNIDPSKVTFLLKKYHPADIGARAFFVKHDLKDPVMFASGACHYSIPKAAALLGLGSNALITVPVDIHARIDQTKLKAHLMDCNKNKIPVIHCVGINGTTEETAVDDLEGLVNLRAEMNKLGLAYNLVCDSAWGGYFNSLIKDDYKLENPFDDVINPRGTSVAPAAYSLNDTDAELFASKYFARQLRAVKNFDTVTVDPHKAGYIHYAVGAIGYRNKRFRDCLSFSAVYIGGSSVPSVGIYGIEGSKAGSSAVSCFLSHSVMRTTKSGYGMILKRCLLATRLFYLRLLWLCNDNDNFKVVCIPITPSAEKMDYFKKNLYVNGVMKSVDEVCNDQELVQELAEIGPDQNILCFAINFKDATGKWNTDYNQFVDVNNKLYERFDYKKEKGMAQFDLIFSNTGFGDQYGKVFCEDILKRFGITTNAPASGTGKLNIPVLRSTVMDPFSNETVKGSFFDVSLPIFKDGCTKIVTEHLKGKHATKPSL